MDSIDARIPGFTPYCRLKLPALLPVRSDFTGVITAEVGERLTREDMAVLRTNEIQTVFVYNLDFGTRDEVSELGLEDVRYLSFDIKQV